MHLGIVPDRSDQEARVQEATSVQDADMLALASVFDILPFDLNRPGISQMRVERRSATGQPESWAITSMGDNLSRDGVWEFESSPSHRTADFLIRTRWASAREAIGFALAHLSRYPSGDAHREDVDLSPAASPPGV